MAERTLTISSLGKTFSVTGWKTGWAVGPRGAGGRRAHGQAVPDLRRRHAVPARGRGRARARRRGLRGARARAARQARPPVRGPRGGRAWRCCAPPARTSPTSTASATARRSAASWSSAPASWRSRPRVFYDDEEAGRSLVRFAFCKREAVIDEAAAAARRRPAERRPRGTRAPARSCRRAAARARRPRARPRSARQRARRRRPRRRPERLAQAPLAEAVVLPHRVEHAVRVEHEHVARLELDRRRRPALAVERAGDRARARRPASPRAPRTSSGGGWPGAGERQTARRRRRARRAARRRPCTAAGRAAPRSVSLRRATARADVARQLRGRAQR